MPASSTFKTETTLTTIKKCQNFFPFNQKLKNFKFIIGLHSFCESIRKTKECYYY